MRLGLFDTIGIVISLAFAFPVANFGVMRIMNGDTTMGAALVIVGVAMVVLPQVLFDPGRILRELLRALLPRQLRREKDTAESTAPETDSTTEK